MGESWVCTHFFAGHQEIYVISISIVLMVYIVSSIII